MAEEKEIVKIPKWTWGLIVVLGLGLVGTITSLIVYIDEERVTELKANTTAINKLEQSLTQFSGSVDLLRRDVYGTLDRLQDKTDVHQKAIEDFEQRLRKLEGR